MMWGSEYRTFEAGGGTVTVNSAADRWCLVDVSEPTLARAVQAVLDYVKHHKVFATKEWLDNLRRYPRGGVPSEAESWIDRAMTIPSSLKVGRVSLELRFLGELRLSGALLWPVALRHLPHPVPAADTRIWGIRILAGMTPFEKALLQPPRPATRVTAALIMSCSPMAGVDSLSQQALLDTLGVLAGSEHAHSLDSPLLMDLYRRLEGQKRGDGSLVDLALPAEQILRDRGVRGTAAPRYGDAGCRPDGAPWVEAFGRMSMGSKLKSGAPQRVAHRLWLEYCATLGKIPAPAEVTRAAHVEGPRGFKRWLQGRGGATSRDVVPLMGDIFEMLCEEGHMDANPIWSEADRPPALPANAISNKAVVPREVLVACATVVNELLDHARRQFEGLHGQGWKPAGIILACRAPGDVAASDACSPVLPAGLLKPECFRGLAVTLRGEDGTVVRVLNPVLPTLLLWLLKAPHRTFQARMVDSGEGDELIPELSFVAGDHGIRRTVVSWLPNSHPLATKGRRKGVIREVEDDVLGQTIPGIFLNTNKTHAERDKDGEDPGFELAWDDPETHEALYELRRWQQRCNAVDRLIPRDELRAASLAPSDGLRGKMPGYAYLFRHAQDKDLPGRLEPPTHSQAAHFFYRVLDEVEARIAKADEAAGPGEARRLPPRIVLSRDVTGMPDRCIFSLHSLRVTGITALLEAGVPFWMVSRLVAGHATWLMTLRYAKPSPGTVWEAVRGVAAGAQPRDGGDARADVSAMGQEELQQHMVSDGHPMAAGGTQVAGFWRWMHDGVCPTGETMCHEGGPQVAGSRKAHGPVEGGARNCALCRFFLTGPAFIEGQVDVVNATLHGARRRAEGIRELHAQRRAPENSRRRASFDDRVERAEAELHLVVRGIHARMRLIHASLALAKAQGAGEDAAGASQPGEMLLTRMTGADIEARLREASELGALDQVSRIAALVPHLDVGDALTARNELIDRLFDANGFEALLYRLPARMARAAGDAVTDGVRAQAPPGMEPDEFLDMVAEGRSKLFELDVPAIEARIARAVGDAIRIVPRPTQARLPGPASTAGSGPAT